MNCDGIIKITQERFPPPSPRFVRNPLSSPHVGHNFLPELDSTRLQQHHKQAQLTTSTVGHGSGIRESDIVSDLANDEQQQENGLW